MHRRQHSQWDLQAVKHRRVRHLAVGQLWVQDRIRHAAHTTHNVSGDCNPADLRNNTPWACKCGTIHFALPQTSKPVEQEARHLFPPRLSCFQQVGDCCLPSMDVTRLTPNDEEECAAEHVHHQHDSDTELTGTFDTRGQTKCETQSLWKHIIALSSWCYS